MKGLAQLCVDRSREMRTYSASRGCGTLSGIIFNDPILLWLNGLSLLRSWSFLRSSSFLRSGCGCICLLGLGLEICQSVSSICDRTADSIRFLRSSFGCSWLGILGLLSFWFIIGSA
jgi:hypothetical protein